MEELASVTRQEKETKGLILEREKNCVYLQITKSYAYKIIGNLQ